MNETVFIVGGARSGKSRLAEKLLATSEKVTYVATAVITDAEMQSRVDRHRQVRPPAWRTVEAPLRPDEAFASVAGGAVLVDCLSVWVSNLLLGFWNTEHDCPTTTDTDLEESFLTEIDRFLETITAYQGRVVIVSNEVGAGIVPANRLARTYRDLLGCVNQKTAAVADTVYWCVSGIPVPIKGGKDERKTN